MIPAGFAGDLESSPHTGIEIQILNQALYFMPKSLAAILGRNRKELESGFESLQRKEYLVPGGRSLLEDRLAEEMRQISSQLRNRPRFSVLARELGLVAQMVVCLNLPDDEALPEPEIEHFLRYVEKNCHNFRLVVYDDPADAIVAPEDLLQQIRTRRNRISEQYHESYPVQLGESAWNDFDTRSPMFGISSLFYSHSVNDIAALWLWAWSSANGDMTGRRIFSNEGVNP